MTGVGGNRFTVGAGQHGFSLQSLTKPFVYALNSSHRAPSGAASATTAPAPSDSIMAVELSENRTMNPMVNAGALAAASLAPGRTGTEQWEIPTTGVCPCSPGGL